MSEESKESIELKEKELEAAAGGTTWTQNRYDPNRCRGLTQRISGVCAAFPFDCDHFNEEWVRGTSTADGKKQYNISRNMGAFPPYSEMQGGYNGGY